MALATKSDLKTACRRGMFDRADIEAQMDDAIELTEEILNHGTEDYPALRVREMLEIADVSVLSGTGTLPDDFLQISDVWDATTSPTRFPAPATGPQGRRSSPYSYSGPSLGYSVVGTNLNVAPLFNGMISIAYYGTIPPLTNEADFNWLLRKHPGVYLHGCLSQLADFLKADDELMKQAKLFRARIVGLNRSDMLATYAVNQETIGGLVV